MNWDAWKPLATLIFTSLLKFVGGLLVAHGLATNGPGLEAMGGAATTAAGALWSWWVQKGHIQAADYLKKLTDTATTAAAVAVAKQMAPAAVTGAATKAKNEVAIDAAKAAVKILLVAFLLSGLFAFPGDASAQINLLPKPSVRAAAAVAPARADPLTKFISDLESVKQEVVDGAILDFTAADADAGSLLNASDTSSFKDPISHACYPAAIKFLQSLPVATPTTGKFIVVQLFQKKRDFVAQIQAGIPVYLKLGCAPLLGDEVQIFAKLMGLIGVQVAANSLLPGLGFALPTL